MLSTVVALTSFSGAPVARSVTRAAGVAMETREDLKMPERPEELVKSIREGFDAGDSLILAVVKAMGEEHVMACKKDTS